MELLHWSLVPAQELKLSRISELGKTGVAISVLALTLNGVVDYCLQIPTSQSAKLGGSSLYMRKLLSIIKSRIDTRTVDITLKFTLSTLWNLSGK